MNFYQIFFLVHVYMQALSSPYLGNASGSMGHIPQQSLNVRNLFFTHFPMHDQDSSSVSHIYTRATD